MCEASNPDSSCPVHSRTDFAKVIESTRHVKLITYVDKYVVYTKVNNVTADQVIDSVMQYGVEPHHYVTMVYEVGKTGVMWDIFGGHGDETREEMALAQAHSDSVRRFREGHSHFHNVRDAHDMVCEGILNGILLLDGEDFH